MSYWDMDMGVPVSIPRGFINSPACYPWLFYKIGPDSAKGAEADESAVGTINRPLRFTREHHCSRYNRDMSGTSNISTIETVEFLKGKYGSGVADVEAIGEGGWSVAFAFVHNGTRNVIRWSDVVDNFE